MDEHGRDLPHRVVEGAGGGSAIRFEDSPVTGFHRRLVVGAAAGQFSDGFSVGVIGIALTLAQKPLGLSDWWMGALGAASLFGLFVGSLIAGAISDRLGRRLIFKWGMLLFTLFAVLQYLSSTAYELFAVRILVGIALGSDYVTCKAMVTEYSPTRVRGPILSILAASWTGGYLAAFTFGFLVRESGEEAWRLALVASAAPSFMAYLLRQGIPESPQWLTRMGRADEARVIIARHLGPHLSLPLVDRVSSKDSGSVSELLKPPLVYNLIVGCAFHTAQVIPLFALGTFLPIVMAKMGLGDGFSGALMYNVVFMLGAIAGMFIIDRIPRRTMLVHGFLLMAALLAILTVWRSAPVMVIVPLFATFSFVLSIAGILQFVYPPELFPTELRARGMGGILAISRIGTASSTFLLPVVVERFGVHTALGFCMGVMLLAAAICFKWAPETLRKRLV